MAAFVVIYADKLPCAVPHRLLVMSWFTPMICVTCQRTSPRFRTSIVMLSARTQGWSSGCVHLRESTRISSQTCLVCFTIQAQRLVPSGLRPGVWHVWTGRSHLRYGNYQWWVKMLSNCLFTNSKAGSQSKWKRSIWTQQFCEKDDCLYCVWSNGLWICSWLFWPCWIHHLHPGLPDPHQGQCGAAQAPAAAAAPGWMRRNNHARAGRKHLRHHHEQGVRLTGSVSALQGALASKMSFAAQVSRGQQSFAFQIWAKDEILGDSAVTSSF